MSEFEAMHKYFVIFLVLIACHGSIFAHGRQIKPLNQHSSLNPTPGRHKDDPQPIPTPSTDQLKVYSTIMSKVDFVDDDSADSGANNENAFRPTTPGNSPGVGHHKFVEYKDMKVMGALVQSPDVKVSMAEGFENDFRPTKPGHSPGVGHLGENKNGQMN